MAPDVKLLACVGATTTVNATFEGAPRQSDVIVTHAFVPISSRVPRAWGGGVRARFASILLEHRVVVSSDNAVLLVQGAAGPTPVPVDLEPGACYVAVGALEHGRARGHGLRYASSSASGLPTTSMAPRRTRAAVGFCARDAEHGRLEVDTRSSGAGWAVAVFRVAGGAWSEDR